ncbi:MAG: sodium-dependent transporter [Cyclobacteriaceae bacterium]|nr:sodium-dependent transporter [Cyclobacteriaceae bacterium]
MKDHNTRGQFTSSLGFIMAAAGSAIGLGNIWGFPTQTAMNGGAGFVLAYIVLIFLIGYPLLLAEFVIGRYAQSNPIGAYMKIKGGRPFIPAGFLGLLTVGFVLSFYCMVAGKMLAHFVGSFLEMLQLSSWAQWVVQDHWSPSLIFTTVFFLFTWMIISAGVKNGIEKWSTRLMPLLLVLMIVLVVYVLTLDGASQGLKAYLLPDFSKILRPQLLISALGQAFFSLSLGVGGMMVLASYTSKRENLTRMGLLVTLADLVIAFLAGLLIIPAMYVAAANGTAIFDAQGNLTSGMELIFRVLPALFDSLGNFGVLVSAVFFLLMSLAAITSSISMMEVPASYLVDNKAVPRKQATFIVGIIFWLLAVVITVNGDWLFGLVVTATTQYSQPLLGLLICIFAGWVMDRNAIIKELSSGNPQIGSSLFMKIWPIFVKFITPLLILMVFLQSFL